MDWKTTDKIEDEFFKLNPLMENLKNTYFSLSKDNVDRDKLLFELSQTIDQLSRQQGVIFNMIDEQRNK